jgi:hypothetical protein
VKPALVILAAGASTRLGTCKALASITPRCALEVLLENGQVLDDVSPLVVTGKDHDAIVRAIERMVLASRTDTRSRADRIAGDWSSMSVDGRCQAPIAGTPTGRHAKARDSATDARHHRCGTIGRLHLT